jgi:hypothetical protein
MKWKKGLAAGAFIALTAFVGVGCSGCATIGGARHKAVITIKTAHTVLASVQDFEMTIVCGRADAPPEPACVTTALHKEVSEYLAEAFEYDKQVAEIVKAIPPGAPAPVEVFDLINKISALVNKILGRLPDSFQKDAFVQKIASFSYKYMADLRQEHLNKTHLEVAWSA